MKKTIICLGIFCQTILFSQNTVADFENFTLTANSAYAPTVSVPFQTSNAIFEYEWTSSFGGFWSGGFVYTNQLDSSNGTFSNLYGVKAFKGNANSSNFVIGQDGAVVKLKQPASRLMGFYITNTTYAFNAIKNGNSFSRKFGDTTGTKSTTTMAQGSYPDFFKVTAKGFLNGTIKSDSAVFYLADYRFTNSAQDYVVKTWQYFNTSNLGLLDSVQFLMYSSDNSFGFMNTPAFFGMDNFTTSINNPTDLLSLSKNMGVQVYPNPFNTKIKIVFPLQAKSSNTYSLLNELGQTVLKGETMESELEIQTMDLTEGIYFLSLQNSQGIELKKLIKYKN